MSDIVSMKLIVIYPRPRDIQAFKTVYNRDHVPMAARASRFAWRNDIRNRAHGVFVRDSHIGLGPQRSGGR